MVYTKKKYINDECDDAMTFQECELAILRHAVDENENTLGEKKANSEDVKTIIKILEKFLVRKKCICYGGTAINNILPKYAQFYNHEIEIPDYDFFSNRALDDAKELADVYYNAGYKDVEAKAGMHHGTFKVFVNFIPVADITYLHDEIYNALQKEVIVRAGIRYAPPNYLRMSMYLELSRPQGDVSRWEKVFKRLTLLNKYYKLNPHVQCNTIDFQREMYNKKYNNQQLYFITRDSLIEQGVVFFGGYGSMLYSKYLNKQQRNYVKNIPDFDVLSEDPEISALILYERLNDSGFKNIKMVKHDAIGELIPERMEITVGKDTIAFIFKPIACHSYNTINIGEKSINVATIDTILSFYLAFIYTNKPYFNKDRILCMAQFLFDVEQKNRLRQYGLLKRFTMNCYGKQETLETIRALKTDMYKKLANQKGSREYDMWFLKYDPSLKPTDHKKPPIIIEDKKPPIIIEDEPNPIIDHKTKNKTQNRRKRPESKSGKYKSKLFTAKLRKMFSE